MSRESNIEALKRRSPPWDDLTQRRVLNQVHAAHARNAARRRTRRIVAAGAGATLLACIALFAAWPSSSEDVDAAQIANLEPAPPATVSQGAMSVVSFADGSKAFLSEGSTVDTQAQREDLVRLSQTRGRVRYEVAPNPGRIFVVHVGAYQVQVVGTVFAVAVTDDRVQVEVERGRVEVDRRDHTLVLDAGDRVDLPLVLPPAPATVPQTPPPAEAPPTKTRPVPSATRLLERADKARRSGDLRDAATALRTLVETHDKDARTPSAWFMLGRVERQRGRHTSAARAFRRAWKQASSRSLQEDARAEEALSWARAGSAQRAQQAATAYLERYPQGTHRARVQAIVR
mgnify:CR=1 FL=1